MERGRPTIVLSMIVKNEAPVIARCLQSIRPIVDAYCIVDTGSTDGTQDVIRQTYADLPGQVYDVPWRDFAYNRSAALRLARSHGDFALMIDADTVCIVDPGVTAASLAAQLDSDYYSVVIDHFGIEFPRPTVTSGHLDFSYRGVLHEFVAIPDGAVDGGLLPGIRFRSHADGARGRNPKKFLDDALVLERAVRGDELDLVPRYQFYLAQSYRDAGESERALTEYRKRAAMAAGYQEERAVSLMNCGHLLQQLGHPIDDIFAAYLHAFDIVPWRSEWLYHAAVAARLAERLPTAYTFAHAGVAIERPAEALFLEPAVYEWRLDYELSIASYYVNRFDEGAAACKRVLAHPDVPGPERQATERNLSLYS